MAELAPVDYTATALDSLPSRYIDAARLRALVTVYAQTFQAIDDVALAIAAQGGIADAEGVQLDQIGALIGQPRLGGAYPGGQSDAEYRPFLYARQATNASHGTAEEIIAILKLILGAQMVWAYLVDTPPAAFACQIYLTAPLADWQRPLVVGFVRDAKAAGVGVELSALSGDVFAFDGFPTPPGAGYDVGAYADLLYP